MTCAALCPGVEILDHTAFAALAPEWEALLARSSDSNIFLTPTFHRVWWEQFGGENGRILTSRSDDGVLEALLPLQIESQGGERILSLAGDPEVADYMDALAPTACAEELLSALWRHALRVLDWDRVELRHVPASSPLTPALRAVVGGLGIEMEVEQEEVCPVAPLPGSWDAFLESLTKKQRHELRRKLRRAQEGVNWSWRTVATVEELERDLAVFFRLHEMSVQDKARFMTPPMRSFFRALAGAMLERGILRLSVFRRDGLDIAAVIGFLYRERYLLYNSAYDPSQRSHSPGIVAAALAIQDAIAAKATVFDFLSGDEPYKYQFGATDTHTCRVQVWR